MTYVCYCSPFVFAYPHPLPFPYWQLPRHTEKGMAAGHRAPFTVSAIVMRKREREKEGTRRTSQNQTTQPRTTREGDRIARYGCSSCLTTNCPLTRDMYGKSSKISASCEWARFHDLSPLAGAGAGMKKSPNLML